MKPLLGFLLRSSRVKIFHNSYNFLDTHATLLVTPTNYALHVDMPSVQHTTYTTYVAFPLDPVYFRKKGVLPVVCLLPASDSSSVLPMQYRWSFCVLCTLGNKSVSSDITQTVYTACQKESSSQYSTLFPNRFLLIPFLVTCLTMIKRRILLYGYF